MNVARIHQTCQSNEYIHTCYMTHLLFRICVVENPENTLDYGILPTHTHTHTHKHTHTHTHTHTGRKRDTRTLATHCNTLYSTTLRERDAHTQLHHTATHYNTLQLTTPTTSPITLNHTNRLKRRASSTASVPSTCVCGMTHS